MRELVAPVADEAVPPVRLAANAARAAATLAATPAATLAATLAATFAATLAATPQRRSAAAAATATAAAATTTVAPATAAFPPPVGRRWGAPTVARRLVQSRGRRSSRKGPWILKWCTSANRQGVRGRWRRRRWCSRLVHAKHPVANNQSVEQFDGVACRLRVDIVDEANSTRPVVEQPHVAQDGPALLHELTKRRFRYARRQVAHKHARVCGHARVDPDGRCRRCCCCC